MIALNKLEYLPHGWVLVKNRSTKQLQQDVSIHQRDKDERDFFTRPPWSSLSQSRLGIDCLRGLINDLVGNMVHQEYNNLLETFHDLSEVAYPRQLTEPAPAPTTERGEKRGSQFAHDKSTRGITEGIEDLEAGPSTKRPRVLINACTVMLTTCVVMTLLGLGGRQLAQEIAIDHDWSRLALLVTAPLQVFVSLVSPPRHDARCRAFSDCSSGIVLLSVINQFHRSTPWPGQPNEEKLALLLRCPNEATGATKRTSSPRDCAVPCLQGRSGSSHCAYCQVGTDCNCALRVAWRYREYRRERRRHANSPAK